VSVFQYMLILARTWADHPGWRNCLDHVAREVILSQPNEHRRRLEAEWLRMLERETEARKLEIPA